MTRVVLFAVLIASYACFAADLTTKDGRKYTNYTVYRVSKRGIHITHDEGGATVPFAQLPDDVRRKYAAQERRFAEQSAAQSARRADELALKKIELIGEYKVFQIIDGNSALIQEDWGMANADARFYGGTPLTENIYCLIDINTAKLHDGVLIPPNDKTRRHSWQPTGGSSFSCSNCYRFSPIFNSDAEKTKWLNANRNTQCVGRGIVKIWRIGTYSYVSTSGSRKTILKFTYSREKALKIVHPLRKLVISGRFDGAGEFTIHGDRITYRHESWDRPTNVTVNGKPWSDLGSPFNLPGWVDVRAFSFRKASGRDKAEFRTDGENGIIRVDDGPNGADDYTMELLSNKDSVPVSQ